MNYFHAVAICLYMIFPIGIQRVYAQTTTGYSFPHISETDFQYKIAREKIDSISRSMSLGHTFCEVYSGSMRHITKQIQEEDPEASLFIKKFTISFAGYFLQPLDEFEKGVLSPISPWVNYFSHPGAQKWQLVLTGVNTHINADMWKALVDNFTGKEILQHKKLFLSAQRSVGKVYRPFYDSILANNRYLRFMHSFTKGLPFLVGDRVLYKWRQRQVRLAMLYYHDRNKFHSLLKRVQRKKLKNDALILRERK